MTLLAKPDKTLLQHLKESLSYAKELAPKITNKVLYKAALLATALHDVGKADRRFQKYIRGGIKSPSHPFLGLSVIEQILNMINMENPLKSIVLLAIASHHSPLTGTLFQNKRKSLRLEIEPQEIPEFEAIITNLLNDLGYDLTYNFDVKSLLSPKIVFERAKWAIFEKPDIALRNQFIYVEGILMQSDYFSSAERNLVSPNLPQEFIAHPYGYQIRASKLTGNVFITLPTGAGKTETALYWARNSFTRKLFYVLPTTTTINAMYTRLRQIFGKEITSLYHSYLDIFIYLARKQAEDEAESYENMLFSKYFLYPINVTTPDQLILSMLNYKRYPLKNFNLYNATIIFDEIHSYDAETFFLIKYLLKYLQEFNPRVCIMSATFPKRFKEELSFLSAVELLPTKEVKKIYQQKERTKLIFMDSTIMDSVDDIIKEYNNGKNVLVVLNTVKRAQEMYERLKDMIDEKNRILLFHSRFTFKDKIKKECLIVPRKSHSKGICKDITPIRRPHILVATQVVEVSLDIDYDVLFTEASYFDSLVQRAGRVNRFGRHSKPCNVFVYQPITNMPYERDLIETTLNLLENEVKNIKSEWDYVRLTNKFYDSVWDIIKSDEEDRYKKVWEHFSYVFSIDLSDDEAQKLIRTRSGIISIPAIPYGFKNEIYNINQDILELSAKIKKSKRMVFTTKEGYQLLDLIEKKKMYLVNVPLFYFYALEKDYIGEYFVNLEYSEELGLIDAYDPMS